jgi:hypothetical protein
MTKKHLENLIFHIKSDDYFGTLATILELIKQDIENKKETPNIDETLKNIVKDLMYLQKHYTIKKNENRNKQN